MNNTTATATATAATVQPIYPAVALGTTSAKATKRGIRLWTENRKALEAAGFSAGTLYSLALSHGKAALTVSDSGKAVSTCKKNGEVRPVIDLHSKALLQYFTAGSAVTIIYGHGTITFIQQ